MKSESESESETGDLKFPIPHEASLDDASCCFTWLLSPAGLGLHISFTVNW